MKQLYCDGGVIASNPSAIGGTYAWCQVEDGVMVLSGKGVITPAKAQMPAISNNLTEMLALVKGLESLPAEWIGEVCSDSQITLGRAFQGWKWTGIPDWLRKRYQDARQRLVNYNEFRYILHAGHPTKAQLEAGIGRHGYRVSAHNVWCDKACGEAGQKYLESMAAQIPSMEPAYAS